MLSEGTTTSQTGGGALNIPTLGLSLVSRVTRMFAARAPVAALLCSSRHRRVWLRRGLGVSNNFIPLFMADQLQQPEPGGSVGRGPTADHPVHFQPAFQRALCAREA